MQSLLFLLGFCSGFVLTVAFMVLITPEWLESHMEKMGEIIHDMEERRAKMHKAKEEVLAAEKEFIESMQLADKRIKEFITPEK